MAERNEPLTERELEVVRLVATGMTNKEVAGRLVLSPSTVKVHLNNIFTKLDVRSRTELSMLAVRNGWVEGGPGSQAAATVSASGFPAPPAGVAGSGHVERTTQPLRVAPNPQPLPRLQWWRRVLLLCAIATGFTAAIVPARTQPDAQATSDDGTLIQADIRNDPLLPGEASRWFLRAPLSAPRARATAGVVDGRIYLIGGEVNQVATGDVLLYEPRGNQWRALREAKPTPAWNSAAAVIDTRIFVSGGSMANGVTTDRLEAFDTVRQTWQGYARMPVALAGHAMAAFGGKLYVFGGRSGDVLSPDTLVYDIETDSWSHGPPMPTPRSLSAAAALGDRIYIIGGYDDGRESAACEAYAPATARWFVCPRMALPRGSLGLVRIAGVLWAVGGGRSGFMGFSERFDPAANRWTTFETPQVGDWHSMAAVALGGEMYVFGGYSNGRRLASAYLYDAVQSQTYLPALRSQP